MHCYVIFVYCLIEISAVWQDCADFINSLILQCSQLLKLKK